MAAVILAEIFLRASGLGMAGVAAGFHWIWSSDEGGRRTS